MRLRNIPEAKEIVRGSRFVLPYGDDTLKEEQEIEAARVSSAKDCAALCTGKELAVEIGMGKGGFIIEMARRHPEYAFLGVERYESVLLRAVQKMEEETPENLLFLCMDAAELPLLLPRESVSRLYLNFSDPWPKARHAKRRLTSPQFLAVYEKFMKRGGELIFKTDNTDLFDFSEESLGAAEHWTVRSVTRNLHKELAAGEENVMTEYERKFSNLGSHICRLIAEYTPDVLQ